MSKEYNQFNDEAAEYIFIDTNLLLECKSLKMIDWSILFSKGEFVLLISLPVIEEIDKKKTSGKERVNRKARQWNSILKPNYEEEVYTDDTLNVKICIAPLPDRKLLEDQSGKLNLSKIDHEILANALVFAQETENVETSILTYDNNMMILADQCKFKHYKIPDEWLLEREEDSKEKKIRELEKELLAIKNAGPIIEVKCDYNAIIESYGFKALDEREIETLISEVTKAFPKKEKQNAIGIAGLMPSKFAENENKRIYDKYSIKEYPEWIGKVKSYLEELHVDFERHTRNTTIRLEICNSGVLPAFDFILNIICTNCIIVNPNKYFHDFPLPPKYPNTSSILSSLSAPMPRIVNDSKNSFSKYEFELVDKDVNKLVYECKQFRHKSESEKIEFNIEIDENVDRAVIKYLCTSKESSSYIEDNIIISQTRIEDEEFYNIADVFLKKLISDYNGNKKQEEPNEH